MTTNDRIHEQNFCYDDDVPPSVPAGAPLRERPTPGGIRRPARAGIRGSCLSTLASLRGRLGGGE